MWLLRSALCLNASRFLMVCSDLLLCSENQFCQAGPVHLPDSCPPASTAPCSLQMPSLGLSLFLAYHRARLLPGLNHTGLFIWPRFSPVSSDFPEQWQMSNCNCPQKLASNPWGLRPPCWDLNDWSRALHISWEKHSQLSSTRLVLQGSGGNAGWFIFSLVCFQTETHKSFYS